MAPMHDAHQRMVSSIWLSLGVVVAPVSFRPFRLIVGQHPFLFGCPADGAVCEEQDECAVNVEMFAVCDGCDLDAEGWVFFGGGFFLRDFFGGFNVTHGFSCVGFLDSVGNHLGVFGHFTHGLTLFL